MLLSLEIVPLGRPAAMPSSLLWLTTHVSVDQAVGRHVMVTDGNLGFDFLLNLARELFPEFNAHLIKGIDVPDNALNKDLVLIESNETPEGFWRQFLVEERVGRAISAEGLGRGQILQRLPFQGATGSQKLRLCSLGCFANHQGFRLRNEIGYQEVMMRLIAIVAFNRRKKVRRNQRRSLMHQLIEGVLSVGAGLTKNNRARAVIDGVTVQIDTFPVTLHVALLQIGGQIFEVLIVRENRVGFGREKVVVPNAEEPHDDGDILIQGCRTEMLIRLVSPHQ